jgi:hypothetical protein
MEADEDVYKAPGADAILNRAAKQPIAEEPAESRFLYRAAWRTEGGRLAPFGGHDLQTAGPLGDNAELGKTGELTATYKATILADARAVFGRLPPQPDAPDYSGTPSYKQTFVNKLG